MSIREAFKKWLSSRIRYRATAAEIELSPALRRRTPVSFRQLIAPGGTAVVRPKLQPPGGFEADRFLVPADAPRCFAVVELCLRTPVSITVRNDGAEVMMFEAALMGDTPRGVD